MADPESDVAPSGRVREITGKRNSGKDVKRIIAELTRVVRGWGNYFRTGNADREFNKIRLLRRKEPAPLAFPAGGGQQQDEGSAIRRR